MYLVEIQENTRLFFIFHWHFYDACILKNNNNQMVDDG